MSQPLGPRVHRLGPEQLGPYVNVKGIFVLGVLPDPVVHPLDAPELLENSSDAVLGEPTDDVRRTLLAARPARTPRACTAGRGPRTTHARSRRSARARRRSPGDSAA